MSDMHIVKVIREIQGIRRQAENLTEAIWRDPALDESLRKDVAMIVMRIQETFADILDDIIELLKRYGNEVHDDH